MIVNGEMRLNDAGRMIRQTWHETPDHHPGIELDVMQIMPNHLHGIIVVRDVGADTGVRPYHVVDRDPTIQIIDNHTVY